MLEVNTIAAVKNLDLDLQAELQDPNPEHLVTQLQMLLKLKPRAVKEKTE